MLIRTATAAAIALAPGAAIAGTGNLVFDPSFESPQFDGGGLNWSRFFGGLNVDRVENTANARTGDNYLRLFSVDGKDGNNQFAGVNSTVLGITGGGEYEMALWAAAGASIQLDTVEFRLEWRDANNELIGDQFGTNTAIDRDALTGEYQQFSFTAFAPDDAVAAVAVIAIQSFDAGGIGADVWVDDVSVTLVPTPAGIGLIACTGLIAARRRR